MNWRETMAMGAISALLSCGHATTAATGVSTTKATTATAPLVIKAVVVTMFELGKDTGDTPGELQTWVEKFPLAEELPFPQGSHALRYNRERGVLAVVTGLGTARASSSIMALGMDPRFDLSKAYWVVAGIAGGDPEDISLGSAAWAEWIVDGDLRHEIDAREIPPGWKTGSLPLRKTTPYEGPPTPNFGAVFHLDHGLVAWAYQLTKDLPLSDSPELRERRRAYVGYPNAQKPPSVLAGDIVSASTYWHGKELTRWANDWMAYWTEREGRFVASSMEDSGTLQALTFLGNAGRVDRRRVLVLRAVSNYTMQHDAMRADESLALATTGKSPAFFPSLAAAYGAGGRVVRELVDHWDRFGEQIPSAP